jgi:hypothetical protein
MKVEITLGTGKEQRLILDGHDATRGFSSLTLTMDTRDFPQLTLKAPVFESGWVEGDAEVDMHPETEEALIKLGWTPPDITAVTRVALGPNDVIVVRANGRISAQRADRMSKMMQLAFPDHRTLIVDDSVSSVEVTQR